MILAAMFLIAPTMAAADAGYSAIVMDVKGKVSLRHAGKSRAVNLGCLLYPDDSLETAKEATLTVTYLESGQEEQWAGGARFVVGKDGSKPTPGKIIKKDKISVPQIASPQKGSFSMKRMSPQQAGGFVMKSTQPPQSGRLAMMEVEDPRDRALSIGAPKAQVLGLSNTRILDEKPIFRWRSTASAQYYQIEVYNLSDDEPLCQSTTTTAELPFPSHMPPLSPGGAYKWVVTAYKDGRSVAQRESCFGLPQIDELTEIRSAVDGYREQLNADQEDTAARLRFALFLEGRQLYDEALEQYQVLKRSHGDSDFLMERQRKIIELRNRPCPD
jgi:hypothetical protein